MVSEDRLTDGQTDMKVTLLTSQHKISNCKNTA